MAASDETGALGQGVTLKEMHNLSSLTKPVAEVDTVIGKLETARLTGKMTAESARALKELVGAAPLRESDGKV